LHPHPTFQNPTPIRDIKGYLNLDQDNHNDHIDLE
jgi:hypothetical protein